MERAGISLFVVLMLSSCTVVAKGKLVCKADVLFLIDQSDESVLRDMNDVIVKTIDTLDMDHVRVGMIGFSKEARVIFPLEYHNSRDYLKSRIGEVEAVNGGRNLTGAIRTARHHMMDRVQVDEPLKIFLLILTSAVADVEVEYLNDEAARTKITQDILIFVVNMQNMDATDFFSKIVSFPSFKYYFLGSEASQFITAFDSSLANECINMIQSEISCYIDLVFIIDGSASVGYYHWTLMIEFMIETVQRLLAAVNSSIKVAAVTFGNTGHVEFRFHDNDSEEEILNALSNMWWLDQQTNTSGGIRTVLQHIYGEQNGDRLDSGNVAIIITDGGSNRDFFRLPIDAENLKQASDKVFAIGITDEIDLEELTLLASSEEDIFVLDDFVNLADVIQPIASQTCLILCATDVIFVLLTKDITSSKSQIMLEVMTDIISNLPKASKAGLSIFGEVAHVVWHLNDAKDDLFEMVTTEPRTCYSSFSVNLTSSLVHASESMLLPGRGARSDLRKTIVVFVSDDVEDVGEANDLIKRLNDDGTRVLMVSAGCGLTASLDAAVLEPRFHMSAVLPADLYRMEQDIMDLICAQ